MDNPVCSLRERWTLLRVYAGSCFDRKIWQYLDYIYDLHCMHTAFSDVFFGCANMFGIYQWHQSHCHAKVSQAAGTSSPVATMSSSKTLSGMPICVMLFIGLSKRSRRPKLFHGCNFNVAFWTQPAQAWLTVFKMVYISYITDTFSVYTIHSIYSRRTHILCYKLMQL